MVIRDLVRRGLLREGAQLVKDHLNIPGSMVTVVKGPNLVAAGIKVINLTSGCHVFTASRTIEGKALKVEIKDVASLIGYAPADEDAMFEGVFDRGELIGLAKTPARGNRMYFTFAAKGTLELTSKHRDWQTRGQFRVVYELDQSSHAGKCLSDKVVALIQEA